MPKTPSWRDWAFDADTRTAILKLVGSGRNRLVEVLEQSARFYRWSITSPPQYGYRKLESRSPEGVQCVAVTELPPSNLAALLVKLDAALAEAQKTLANEDFRLVLSMDCRLLEPEAPHCTDRAVQRHVCAPCRVTPHGVLANDWPPRFELDTWTDYLPLIRRVVREWNRHLRSEWQATLPPRGRPLNWNRRTLALGVVDALRAERLQVTKDRLGLGAQLLSLIEGAAWSGSGAPSEGGLDLYRELAWAISRRNVADGPSSPIQLT